MALSTASALVPWSWFARNQWIVSHMPPEEAMRLRSAADVVEHWGYRAGKDNAHTAWELGLHNTDWYDACCTLTDIINRIVSTQMAYPTSQLIWEHREKMESLRDIASTEFADHFEAIRTHLRQFIAAFPESRDTLLALASYGGPCTPTYAAFACASFIFVAIVDDHPASAVIEYAQEMASEYCERLDVLYQDFENDLRNNDDPDGFLKTDKDGNYHYDEDMDEADMIFW